MNQNMNVDCVGHLLIEDTTETPFTVCDTYNAIHPQNVARIFARALSREDNSWIHRVAFGNGGTIVDAAFTVLYRTPNDGQLPDTAGWTSRLYNETYSEIIDDSNVNVTDGTGSTPGDPQSVEHVSGPGVRSSENGISSDVIIEVVLNRNEPLGQSETDTSQTIEDSEGNFVFDEIGLFTTGLPPTAVSGYCNVDVGNKVSTSLTGLSLSSQYEFDIIVDNNAVETITFTTTSNGSGSGGAHTYGDLINDLTPVLPFDSSVEITDTINNVQTYGYLKFVSGTTGSDSQVTVQSTGSSSDLFNNLTDFVSILTPVPGSNAGVQNDPVNSENERERLLTHVIFSPITKTANREYKITYKLTVRVSRSINPDV